MPIVMVTISSKRREVKVSIMLFSSISKRSEHVKNNFRSDTNTLDRKKIIFEANTVDHIH
jgi:hypothetical protein